MYWFNGAGFSSRSHVSSKLSVCCCGSGYDGRWRILLVREALSRVSAPAVGNRAHARWAVVIAGEALVKQAVVRVRVIGALGAAAQFLQAISRVIVIHQLP